MNEMSKGRWSFKGSIVFIAKAFSPKDTYSVFESRIVDIGIAIVIGSKL